MIEYPKTFNVFKRDQSTGKLILGEWSMPELGFLQDNVWTFTEKIDGMNIRVMWDGQSVKFAGRTDRAVIPKNLLVWLNENFPAEKFTGFDGDTCLYGEGYGAGIQQAGRLYSPNQEFVLFDVKIGKWWLTRDGVVQVAQQLCIETVPVVGYGTLLEGVDRVASGRLVSAYGPFEPEGIIARPGIDLFTRSGERVDCKITCKELPI